MKALCKTQKFSVDSNDIQFKLVGRNRVKIDNLAKNTTLLLVGTLLNKCVLLLAIPLFSRWLSTEDYGLFDVYSTYVSLLVPIITISCGDAVFRFAIDQNSIQEKGIYITDGLIVELLAIIGLIFVMIIGFHQWVFFIPFTLYAVTEIIANYLLGYLRSIRKISIYSFCTAISTIFTFIFVFVFVKKMDLKLAGMLYGYIVGESVRNIIVIIYTKFWRYLQFERIRHITILQMLRYSFAFVFSNIFWWIVNVSDRWLINIFLGTYENGIYAAAAKIPNLITAIAMSFSVSWQEAAVDQIQENNRQEYFNNIFYKLCQLLISTSAVFLASSFIIFGLFFDERYATARLYSTILIASSVIHGLIYFFSGINISLKHPSVNSKCVLIGAIVNFIVDVSLIKILGLYAAAISTFVANVVIIILEIQSVKFIFKPHINIKILYNLVIFVYLFLFEFFVVPIFLKVLNLIFAIVSMIVLNHDFLFSKVKQIIIKLKCQTDSLTL